jgi:uncharacterized membrane protein SpoIIM required for sporulation
MILDLDRFLARERPLWDELESLLTRLEQTGARLSIEEVRRLHYLYERAAAALGQVSTFAAEPQVRGYLEALVARAYGEIHESRVRSRRRRPFHWLLVTFPETFRRHLPEFWTTVAITVAGVIFGTLALLFDPDSRRVTMAFGHDQITPTERVRREEAPRDKAADGGHTSFSAQLMTHNTKVSIFTLGMGMTWGIGTVIALFYNGVILGAIATDYIRDGQGTFLAAWLLPHGSVEIPAILVAGQAGLILAGTLIGRGSSRPLRARLRAIGPDLATLIGGVAVLLVWAGIIEAFLSQHHEPVIPYAAKIAFGCVELILLCAWLGRSRPQKPPP